MSGSSSPKRAEEQVLEGNGRRGKGWRATGGGERTGGLSLSSSLFLCIIYLPLLDAFFCQEWDDG